MQSGPGRLFSRVAQLDSMLQNHFTITTDDITAEEFSGLQVLWSERIRWEKDERKRLEMEQARRAMEDRSGRRR